MALLAPGMRGLMLGVVAAAVAACGLVPLPPADHEASTAPQLCDETPLHADRDRWYAEAATFRVTLVDGQPTGDTGVHKVAWSQLVQVIVRSDVSTGLAYEAAPLTGEVASGGQTTLAFPVAHLGRWPVRATDADVVLLELDASCELDR